jgi:hypothetical protein
LQHQEQDCWPATPLLRKVILVSCTDTTGLEQFPHTVFAPLLQLDTLYWPIWHTEQFTHTELTVIPIPVEYVPVEQERHAADEAMAVPLEYVPAEQEMHELELLDATTVEYVPARHETQPADAVMPVPVLYLPAGQTSQFTPDQLAGGGICPGHKGE